MTSIRTEVRETEKHIKSLASTKEMQIKVCSMAQSIAASELASSEHYITVLAIVKNRIIHST